MQDAGSDLGFTHLVGAYEIARDPAGILILRGRGETTIFESQAALELVAERFCSEACPGLLCDLTGIDELPYPTTVVLLVDKLEELGTFSSGVALVLSPVGQMQLAKLAVDHAAIRGLPIRAFTRFDAARDWLAKSAVKKRA